MLSIITMRENKLNKMPNRIPLILVYLFQLGHQNCQGNGSIPCRICQQRVAGRTTLSHHHRPPQNDNLMYQLREIKTQSGASRCMLFLQSHTANLK